MLDYYQKIWELLDKYLENFNSDELREKVLSVLCEAAPDIANYNIVLSKMVFKTFIKLSKSNWVDKRYLMQAVVYILKIGKKRMNKETYSEWEKFNSKLLENNFSNKLKRFVGMNMIEDLFHTKGEYDKEWIELQIKNLASNAAQNPEILLPEFEWLIKNGTGRNFQFGYFLGLSDIKKIFLDEIIRSYKSGSNIVNYQFLGGYLKSIHANNFELWEKIILNLSEDPYFASNFPQLVWYSGVSNNIIEKIIDMLSNEIFGVEKLYSFKFGNIIDQIDESLFRKLILLLLKEKSGLGAGLALDLCYNRYLYPKKSKNIPKNIFKKILLHQAFWENPTKIKHEGMTEFVWKETAKIIIKIFPELQLKITNKILEFFADDNSITGGYHSQINEVLTVIIKEKPRETWKIIEKYIEPPYDSRAFHLTQWLRGGKFFDIHEPSVLEYFIFNDIWKWVEDNPEKRAPYLASFVPPNLFPTNGQPSLTRELLIKYGHLKSVRNSFSANYSTDGWSGSEVKHLQSKKNELIEKMKNERNSNIQLWINEYKKYLDKDIERAKMFEEREGFFNNEE